jgi:SAM-dependent methyltransferase
LAEAANNCDPAKVLDSLIAKYAEVSGGRVSVTARPVADLMAAIAKPGNSTVLDPACGTGELLAAAARYGATRLVGQELDEGLAELAGVRLAVSMGPSAGQVSAGDSLREDRFTDLTADVVLCHPPFGDRDWGHEELALDLRWEYGAPPKGEPELAWAQHAVAHLSPGGRAVLLMPPAAASRASGRRIRAEMLRRGVIKAIIALAPGAVYPRHVGPHLWVLERPREGSPAPRALLIDTASWETVLSAWCSFASDQAASQAEPGVWRSVPVIDLLDESVDLTPSRHVGVRIMASSPQEAAKTVETMRTRLRNLLAALGEALPGGDCRVSRRELRWREVSIGELAVSGMVEVHRASSVVPAADAHTQDPGSGAARPVLTVGDVLQGAPPSGAVLRSDVQLKGVMVSHDDVLLPTATAGPMAVRVASAEDDGAILGRGLYLIRPDPERIDPWFLSGFLANPANAQQATYGTTSTRIDVRRMTVPLLPLQEQQRYGIAFRQLNAFGAAASEFAGLAGDLTTALGKSLAEGALLPGSRAGE